MLKEVNAIKSVSLIECITIEEDKDIDAGTKITLW